MISIAPLGRLINSYQIKVILKHFKKTSKRAIERNIEIIGEAMSRILKVKPDFPITTARKIIDTRDRIIHGYDDVSDQIIWSIVVQYLGALKKEIEDIQKQ